MILYIWICNFLFMISIINCIKPKICTNCKYYLKDLSSLSKLEKCTFFEKIEAEDEITSKRENIKYLISGIKSEKNKKPKNYFLCETARGIENMCGLEGKNFKPFS